MLGLGVLHLTGDRRLTTPNGLDPFILTKDPQRLGDRFVKAACSDIDGVFNAAKVDARYSACLQGHTWQLSHSMFIRY
jgi:hypothetical protein